MVREMTKDLKEICDDLSQKRGYVGFGPEGGEEYNKLDMLKAAVNTLRGEDYIDDGQKRALNDILKKIEKICGIKSRFPY